MCAPLFMTVFVCVCLVLNTSCNCSSANVAEKLFKEDFSEEKNGGTYDAIIQGLLKVSYIYFVVDGGKGEWLMKVSG